MNTYCDISVIQLAENRQRRLFAEEALMELQDSIERIGLMHPIVLRQTEDSVVLVAGERRLRAIQNIYGLGGSFTFNGQTVPAGQIPFVNLGDLTSIEAQEAELEENIRRVDLTWQERAQATAALVALRRAQADNLDKLPPTLGDLAEELKGSRGNSNKEAVSKELIVARHLDNPAVRDAASVKDAFKALKRVEQADQHKKIAKELGSVLMTSKYFLEQADCLQWMQGKKEQFDVICTDPPYGMGADTFGSAGKTDATYSAHGYDDSPENFRAIMEEFPELAYNIAKPDAHLYMFCDFAYFRVLYTLFSDAGWNVFRTPLIWFKPQAFRAPWPEHGPQRKYEMILYARKGDKKTTKIAGDVLTYPADEQLGHSAQKPVGLIRDLLSRSVIPGNTVLDPFCGTGTIFKAAQDLPCIVTGVELDQQFYGIAAKRIQELSGEKK